VRQSPGKGRLKIAGRDKSEDKKRGKKEIILGQRTGCCVSKGRKVAKKGKV